MSLHSSMADFVPCDRLLQKAYYLSCFYIMLFPSGDDTYVIITLFVSLKHCQPCSQGLSSLPPLSFPQGQRRQRRETLRTRLGF